MDFLQLLMHKLDKINDEVCIGVYIYVCVCVCIYMYICIWRGKWQPIVIAQRIPWTEEPGGVQSMRSQRVEVSN